MDLDEISAHLEIRQTLGRYSRGVDRQDLDLLKSVYHDDATDDHGIWKGKGHDFAEWLLGTMKDATLTGQHQITTTYIERDGDRAHVESYYLAFHPVKDPASGIEQLMATGGRYLDVFTRRDGAWRVASRVCTIDWSRTEMPGPSWEGQSQFAKTGPRGSDASDALFSRGI